MKIAIQTSNKKGYISPQNAARNPQAEMITEVSESTKSYGSPAMSPMPASVDYGGGPAGHKVEVQKAEYISNGLQK